jgi:hypothetical protein
MADATVGLLRVLLSADTAEFDRRMAGADASTKKLAATMKRDLEPSQSRINRLVREFAGSKEIGLANDYARAIKEAGGAANLTAQHQEKANRAIQAALTHYRALGKEAPAHLMELERATRRMDAPLKGIGGHLDTAAQKFKMLAGAFGLVVGVGAIVQFGRHIFDTADHLVDMSDKLGVSIEATQRFQYAAKQAGADIDQVGKAIVQMNDRLATGDKSTVAALDAAGLKFDEIRTMKPEEAFRAIADAIAKIPDPMKQTQVAMDLFGKSGAELLPMIRSGALEAADAIKVMSDETVRDLEQAKQTWENFTNAVTIETAEILVAIPKLIDAWKALGRAVIDSPLSTLGTVLKGGGGIQTGNVSLGLVNAAVQAWVKEQETKRSDIPLPLVAPAAAAMAKGANEKTIKKVTSALKDSNRALEESNRLAEEGQRAQEKIAWAWQQHALRAQIYETTVRPVIQRQAEINAKLEEGRDIINAPIDHSFLMSIGQQIDLLADVKIPKLAKRIGGDLRTALTNLPQVILSAISGGGNVGQAIGGSLVGSILGGSLGGSLTKGLSGMFGKSVGGAIGSVIPGVGTLLGGFFGDAIGKLFSSEGRRVNDLRDQFMAANGGFEAMQRTIAEFNNDPQLKAAFEKLYFTGDEGDFNAGMAAYEKRLKEIGAALTEAGGKIGNLTNAAQQFGGVLPKSLHAAAQQILGMSGLTGDLRKQLEALMGQPSWRVLEERASALGIDTAALGGGFNQAKVKDLALGYVRDIEMFKEAGADVDGVLRGMADEISTLLIEAQRTGAALPKTLEPYIKRLGEMGLLLDQNGNAIELGAFSFADFEDEALEALKDLLTEIKDILAKAFPAAASAAARGFDRLRDAARGVFTPVFDTPDARTPGWSMPDLSYAASSLTPTLSPSFAGASLSGDATTVYINTLDGRSLEDYLRANDSVVARVVSFATRRTGLAR